MLLPDQVIAQLQRAAAAHAKRTRFPRPHAWRRLSDDEIWRHFVSQVAVVGGATSSGRITDSSDAQRALRFSKLRSTSPQERRRIINRVLRDCGVRYASSELSKCRKTAAVVRNLDFLCRFSGGPTAYIASLARQSDDHTRVNRLAHDMSYIKLKGARDLLAELGVVTDVIALDIRILNILRELGAELPADVQTNPSRYKQLQDELLTRVCVPMRITGVALDRILFQNYKTIMAERAATPNKVLQAIASGA